MRRARLVGTTAASLGLAAGAVGAGYILTVQGALTCDLGVGRRIRALGPIRVSIAARPQTVFDVISGPYLGRTPAAMASKLQVIERGSDFVLAAHFTPLRGGLTATTVETVRFEPPHRISFRLVRGPVPHVTEVFELLTAEQGTEFVYSGELGTDLWALGAWWGARVAGNWERTVEQSIASIKTESERRASRVPSAQSSPTR